MDLVQIKLQGACSEDMLPELSVSPDISGIWDDFRDPEFLPRIGDEYQAEIPPLVMKSDDFRRLKNQAGGLHDVYIGLPIPIAWINDVQILKQKHNGGIDLVSVSNQNECPAVTEIQDVSEAQEVRPGDDVTNRNLENATRSGDSKNFLLQQEIKIKMNENIVDNGQLLVPDSSNDSWSEMEEASLLLGLYIFGKNLIQVKKFVATKKMGDILSFYYGKFYGSEKYRRWSACRKVRGKRCICGQKLFSGWRQQELSSRLLSPLSEEKQNTLVEVSRRFSEGKILLEEYVFSLKATVGLNALVEAVGIGKGKQDLTGITMDPIKSNHVPPARPDIPVGKACSMLTPVEIVKFLTGDFRLSKARSNDLFWEAVWPRLLAKGWHSEQANYYGSTAGLKHSLVFLIPGVKKFCRRKLVKGDHYFDSVSDVLNKVASDPGLLELDCVVDRQCSDKEESESTDKTKQDQEGFPSQQRYCYLKPRALIHNTDIMKFMVVDTSLANGKTFKVRELRSLPVEIVNTCASRSHSEDDEQSSSEVSMDGSHSDNSMHDNKDVIDVSKATISTLDKKANFDEKNCVGNSSNKESPIDGLQSNISMKIQEDEKTLLDNTQQRKAVLCQMSQEKPDYEADLTAYTGPHWELNTCSQETSCNPINIFTSPELKQELSSSDHDDFSQTILPQVDSSKENLPLTSSSRGNPVISCVDVPPGTCNVGEVPQEKHQPHTFIDLNLPIPQDPDHFGSSTLEIGGQKNGPRKCFDPLNIDKTSESLDISEHYSLKNSRRQSNRNRPPTTRALEAHALGLLDVKQKRKSRDVFLEEDCMLSTSQHAHAKVRQREKFGNSIVDFELEGRESNVCNDNGNVIHKLEV